MKLKEAVDKISFFFVVIGGIALGIEGIFDLPLLMSLFGGYGNPLSRIIYILIGLSALWMIADSVVKKFS